MNLDVTLGVDDLKQYLSKRSCPQDDKLQAQQGQLPRNSTQPPLIDLFLNPNRRDELRKLQQWVEEKEANSTYTEVKIDWSKSKSHSSYVYVKIYLRHPQQVALSLREVG